jgi:hypothetical protein
MGQYDNLSQENKDFLVLVGQLDADTPAPKATKAAPIVDVPAESTETKGA